MKVARIHSLYSEAEYDEAIKYIKNYIADYVDKYGVKPRFFIKTYGCQMNEHDSERIMWILKKLGFSFTDNEKEADYIIYNTCLIRENAELKVFGRVGALKSLKREKKSLKIILCGCMMENEGIRNTIKSKYRHVDIVFGANTLEELPLYIYRNLVDNEQVFDSFDNIDLIVEDISSIRKYDFKAYVNIMYGCNNFCTYCVVPYTRGRERSRDSDDILKEIRALASSGVKEIILLGQNVNSYRGKYGYGFHNLLSDIDKIDGIKRISFMTSHPKDISDELIASYGQLNNLLKYIHLPIQSGSNRILKEMNRKYTVEYYIDKINKIRDIMPNIAISTDIIVGFPGETEEDFQATLDLVKKVKYDSSFSFIYSIRPGTKAANLINQIAEEEKSLRLKRLNDVLNKISYEKNSECIGKKEIVLVEEVSKQNPNILSGRSEQNKLVHFEGNKSLIGELVTVEITNAKSFTLEGVLEVRK